MTPVCIGNIANPSADRSRWHASVSISGIARYRFWQYF